MLKKLREHKEQDDAHNKVYEDSLEDIGEGEGEDDDFRVQTHSEINVDDSGYPMSRLEEAKRSKIPTHKANEELDSEEVRDEV